jgi:hypothetical protein
LATPANLARAGLYYAPAPSQMTTDGASKIVGMDRCNCYKCKIAFASWENHASPWYTFCICIFFFPFFFPSAHHAKHRETHALQNPNCAFIQGKDPSNIPLSGKLHLFHFFFLLILFVKIIPFSCVATVSLAALPFDKHGLERQVRNINQFFEFSF